MIKDYVDVTHNFEFAIKAAPILEKEFNYFLTKSVIVKNHTLVHYEDFSSGPRPESYREDKEIGSSFATDEERENFYSEVKSAAESGMDFSSRWFIDENGGKNGTLKNLKARSIIPVDLNALLYANAKIIAEFYGHNNNEEKRMEFEEKAGKFFTAVNELLWDEESGIWLDYDLINKKLRPYFTPTNFAPLWTNCFDKSQSAKITANVLSYMYANKLSDFPGGIPNTLDNTGEQWDWPNVWAPMMHFVIIGLKNLNTTDAVNMSIFWADRWVRSNYIAFKKHGGMFEKYYATEFGEIGGGNYFFLIFNFYGFFKI